MKKVMRLLKTNRGTFLGERATSKNRLLQIFKVDGKFYSIRVVRGEPNFPLDETLKEIK